MSLLKNIDEASAEPFGLLRPDLVAVSHSTSNLRTERCPEIEFEALPHTAFFGWQMLQRARSFVALQWNSNRQTLASWHQTYARRLCELLAGGLQQHSGSVGKTTKLGERVVG